MSERKKYTMRPAKKDHTGKPQMVLIGFKNGRRHAVSHEVRGEVTAGAHRAYMSGDLEIDGYPHTRPPAGGEAAKEAALKKAKAKADKKKSADKKKAKAEADAKKADEAKAEKESAPAKAEADAKKADEAKAEKESAPAKAEAGNEGN